MSIKQPSDELFTEICLRLAEPRAASRKRLIRLRLSEAATDRLNKLAPVFPSRSSVIEQALNDLYNRYAAGGAL